MALAVSRQVWNSLSFDGKWREEDRENGYENCTTGKDFLAYVSIQQYSSSQLKNYSNRKTKVLLNGALYPVNMCSSNIKTKDAFLDPVT